jgi:hypothetical protein
MLDSMTMTRLSFELAMIRMFAHALLPNSFHHELVALTGVMQIFVNFGSIQQIAVLCLETFCQ